MIERMTIVVNVNSRASAALIEQAKEEGRYVPIHRPHRWGNPYSHLPNAHAHKVATLEDAIHEYEIWLLAQPELVAALPELRGKVLGCYCTSVLKCHGRVLLRLVREMAGSRAARMANGA